MSYQRLVIGCLFTLISLAGISQAGKKGVAKGEPAYFPAPGYWEHREPAAMGLDSGKLKQAIHFAFDHETKNPRNLDLSHYLDFAKEPLNAGLGPFLDRAGPSGLIIYKGYMVASWGDPGRADMVNSVTKSFLSAVIGLAVDRGLIQNVKDPVSHYIGPIELYNPLSPDSSQMISPFSTTHNQKISWDDLLRQTSEWEGTLWSKPDWADRPEGNDPDKWVTRPRNEPGTVWKYNDVRVNALALAATNVWRKPLPEVLQTGILEPIGASSTWRWYGYRNSWIILDGRPVQSVSGGGHWGGGMFMNCFDMARFGLLTLHRGNWDGKQLLSERWIQQSLTPTKANTGYGYMNWFLNTDRAYLPSAPANAFAHIGNGRNIIYVDPVHDLVAVIRWIDDGAKDGFIKLLLSSFP